LLVSNNNAAGLSFLALSRFGSSDACQLQAAGTAGIGHPVDTTTQQLAGRRAVSAMKKRSSGKEATVAADGVLTPSVPMAMPPCFAMPTAASCPVRVPMCLPVCLPVAMRRACRHSGCQFLQHLLHHLTSPQGARQPQPSLALLGAEARAGPAARLRPPSLPGVGPPPWG
jgi:hypothetical protein